MPKKITEELKQPINNSNTNNFNLKSKSICVVPVIIDEQLEN
jgi:hypothetical protein